MGRILFAFLLLCASSALASDRPFIWRGQDPQSTASAGAIAAPAPATRRPGWPAAIGENFGSPTFADLDGDGVMEIITTDRQQTYVFAADGSLWPGWPRPGGSDNIPAVADIDEDGAPEILVASPGGPPKIRCFNSNGTIQAGFPVSLPYQNWLNVTAPAIADVDGDGHLDVGAQSEPGVAFFDRFGQALPGWPYLWQTSQNIVWSAPAVADLDGDGLREVVVGTNCLYACAVHVIRASGKAMPGWPQPTQNIFASPAVGDLDDDGDLEIVAQEGDPTWYGNKLHAWHHDGTTLPGWPIAIAPQWESSRSNPALVDVDADGRLEIVTHTDDAMLHILKADGSEWSGFPRPLPSGSISSVSAIDADGDDLAEFFLCYYSAGSQWVGGWRLDGSSLAGFPKLIFANSELGAHSSAHLADREGDGDLDLCVQGGTFGSGRVCVYEVDGSSLPAPGRRDWPKLRRDAHNTGHAPAADLTAVAETALAPSLGVYPNPVGRDGLLSLRIPDREAGRVALFDLAGRRLADLAVSDGRVDLARFRLAAGVYLLKVEGTRPARLVVIN